MYAMFKMNVWRGYKDVNNAKIWNTKTLTQISKSQIWPWPWASGQHGRGIERIDDDKNVCKVSSESISALQGYMYCKKCSDGQNKRTGFVYTIEQGATWNETKDYFVSGSAFWPLVLFKLPGWTNGRNFVCRGYRIIKCWSIDTLLGSYRLFLFALTLWRASVSSSSVWRSDTTSASFSFKRALL